MFFTKILVYSTGQLIPSNLPEYLAFHSASNTLVQARLRRSPTAAMAAAVQPLARAQADQTRAQVLVQADLVQASTLPAGHLQGPAMEKSKRPAAWQSRGGQGQGGRHVVGVEAAGRLLGQVQAEHQGPARHAHHRQGLQGRVMKSARFVL